MSRLTVNLLDANLETMQVLGSAIAKRDSDTDAHNYRVSVYSVALAEAVVYLAAAPKSNAKSSSEKTRVNRMVSNSDKWRSIRNGCR